MAEIRGGKLFEQKLNDIAARASSAETVKIGFLARSTYPDGTPVALVAAIQNWGAPKAGIPPRPFFSNMIAEKSPEWPKAIADLLVANGYDAALTLAQAGEAVSGQLKQAIVDTNEPPLAPATIKRKGFDKPLISSSHMINSVDYEVKKA
jgi:hypothetical protein